MSSFLQTCHWACRNSSLQRLFNDRVGIPCKKALSLDHSAQAERREHQAERREHQVKWKEHPSLPSSCEGLSSSIRTGGNDCRQPHLCIHDFSS
mmetsp:Transcript_147503/g.268932  ORF Transcript_147503/g.268932 Transcript_147503/m.268932 type:complete len:94 (+) Transcript_147503:32-313(+)